MVAPPQKSLCGLVFYSRDLMMLRWRRPSMGVSMRSQRATTKFLKPHGPDEYFLTGSVKYRRLQPIARQHGKGVAIMDSFPRKPLRAACHYSLALLGLTCLLGMAEARPLLPADQFPGPWLEITQEIRDVLAQNK